MDTRPINILLVEDNPAHVYHFRIFLDQVCSCAHLLSQASTLEHALAHLSEQATDLIILDLTLPDTSGLDGLDAILQAAPDVPVVVHSVLDTHVLIVDAMRRGAHDYLIKNRFDAERLRRVIESALERKWTLQGLLKKEQRLRRIIETTGDGIVIVDRRGHIQFFNHAAQRLLQWTQADLIGADLGFPLAPAGVTELDVPHKDGSVTIVETCITPIQWEGRPCYLASLRDITTHKQLLNQLDAAREQAEEAVRVEASLLANISHELRTPLTAILGFADILIQELSDDHHLEFAAIIKQAGDRLLDTISSVLAFSPLEDQGARIASKKIALQDIVQEVLVLLDPLAREKHLTLELHPPTSPVCVWGNSIFLHRILHSLIGNAIKFTDQGAVEIDIEADEDQVYLHVKDTGQGIDPDFLPHLFEAFHQENAAQNHAKEESGHGLSITNKLVTLLGGAISVESEPGVGSTFSLTLPRARSHRTSLAQRSGPETQRASSTDLAR